MRIMHPRLLRVRSTTRSSRNDAAAAKSGASASADRRPASCRSPIGEIIPAIRASPALLLKPTSQFGVLSLDSLQFIHRALRKFTRARCRRHAADGFRVFQIRVDRRDDHACFDRDEVDTHQRYPYPRIDHDTLIENAIEYVDEGTTTRGAFDGHVLFLE